MKTIDLKIPDIGDADEIELLKWNYQAGQTFSEGDELCDLITDKAAFSLEAPQKGKIIKIIVPERSKVKVGDVVAIAEVDS